MSTTIDPTTRRVPPMVGLNTTVLLHAADTDAVARYLLTQTDARDLEITARGIEEAFLSLTGEVADPDDPDDADDAAAPADLTEGALR